MKRYILSLSCLALGIVSAIAGPIGRNRAEALAKDFMNKRCSTTASLKCIPVRKGAKAQAKDNEKLYVFNIGSDEGFVVVAGDDNAVPVLGYADTGCFNSKDIPANMAEWLKLNEIYVEHCARAGAPQTAGTSRQGTVVVDPLLGDINWGQDYPFNEKCPTYTSGGTAKHYYVGCVATAATQIMKYHNYPQRGTGNKSYTWNGKELAADFGSTVYDWNNMLPFYPETGATPSQTDAAATLAANFGIAVEMDYLPEGSGALSMLVPGALRDYFGYDGATVMRKRAYYSSSEWLELIKGELDAGRPVYYGATSDTGTGGHAFVCDGYDSEGYVHINWGWYGRSNGYFLVNHLNPSELGVGGGTGGYNRDQEIITGIQPATGTNNGFCRPLYSSSVYCSYFGTDFMLMTNLSNYDTKPFDGEVGVALTKGGTTVKMLHVESLHMDGYGKNRGSSSIPLFTIKGISTNTGTSVADGEYDIILVFRESAEADWQTIRHENSSRGAVKATVKNGVITTDNDNATHPDVSMLTPLTPDGDVYAQGSALFRMKLRNNSSNFDLKRITMVFVPEDNAEKEWAYSNYANVYNESTESIDFLINLDSSMPEGTYHITLFEDGHRDHPFKLAEGDEGIITVLPPSAVPVMRMTQNALWRNATDTDILQGDNVTIALNARNYAAAGKVGMTTWLTDVNKPENSYLFQQKNLEVGQGEAVTGTFYRKLPVDPGTYRVDVKYTTEDGNTTTDAVAEACTETMTVGENTSDVLVNAVSLNFPDIIYKGENATGSITLQAPQKFIGTVYIRARQHTITNGEIIYMGSQTINAGETKTINFTYRSPAVAPGEYVILVEAKQGGKEGTVGSYRNCYKLFAVKERPTGITDITAGNESNGNISVAYGDGMLQICNGKGYNINNVEVFGANGQCVLSAGNIKGNCIPANTLGHGMYIARIYTDRGTFNNKFIK